MVELYFVSGHKHIYILSPFFDNIIWNLFMPMNYNLIIVVSSDKQFPPSPPPRGH